MRPPIAFVLCLSSIGGVALGGAGCKGETKFKDSQATLDELDGCHKQLAEKDKLIKDYESTIARDQAQGQKSGDIEVTIEGTVLTVKPAQAGVTRPIDDAAAGAASKEFYDVVQKSRGAIQKCYEGALKKNSGLAAHTVTLTVSASFAGSGAYKDSAFSAPVDLGDAFQSCMHTVATKWALPTNSPAMTLKASVSLTPS